MTRRETYPCAGLQNVVEAIYLTHQRESSPTTETVEQEVSRDALRLAGILGFIENTGHVKRNFQITTDGEQLLTASAEQQKIMLFQALLKQNDVLPPYFKVLLETRTIHNVKLSTRELCQQLDMKDLWSADILNEWCRYLGISKGTTKTEVFISSQEVAQMRREAFALTVQREYARFAGTSGLVPVAKLRRELKNSGVLGPDDDFDKWLEELCKARGNENKITFHPAPARFVGRGLQGRIGYELVTINGALC